MKYATTILVYQHVRSPQDTWLTAEGERNGDHTRGLLAQAASQQDQVHAAGHAPLSEISHPRCGTVAEDRGSDYLNLKIIFLIRNTLIFNETIKMTKNCTYRF